MQTLAVPELLLQDQNTTLIINDSVLQTHATILDQLNIHHQDDLPNVCS
jgi:hypothetical protein